MVSATHAGRRLTYEDFLLFPEGDGLRHEIIDGIHYVTAAPNLRHQDLVGRLHLAIGNFLASHPDSGRIFISPVDVVFTIHDVVEPDLVFVAGDQTDIMTEANIQGPPAIVVEIVSKSTRSRDERIKKQLFDRGGVREYWIVDPDRSQLTVYRRGGQKLDARTTLSAADRAVLTTPLIPGFSLSIADLFRPT
jgi:Uma2 family endonuclease